MVDNGGPLPASCCNGVRGLSKAATTTADKKIASGCIERLFGGIKGVKPALASSLPGKCGVSIPYKISPSNDCSNGERPLDTTRDTTHCFISTTLRSSWYPRVSGGVVDHVYRYEIYAPGGI
ncbi:non-specific lipid-transfer protein 1-like protein [Tanacetum coccineum]